MGKVFIASFRYRKPDLATATAHETAKRFAIERDTIEYLLGRYTPGQYISKDDSKTRVFTSGPEALDWLIDQAVAECVRLDLALTEAEESRRMLLAIKGAGYDHYNNGGANWASMRKQFAYIEYWEDELVSAARGEGVPDLQQLFKNIGRSRQGEVAESWEKLADIVILYAWTEDNKPERTSPIVEALKQGHIRVECGDRWMKWGPFAYVDGDDELDAAMGWVVYGRKPYQKKPRHFITTTDEAEAVRVLLGESNGTRDYD